MLISVSQNEKCQTYKNQVEKTDYKHSIKHNNMRHEIQMCIIQIYRKTIWARSENKIKSLDQFKMFINRIAMMETINDELCVVIE